MDAWYMRNAQYRDVEAERMPLKAVLKWMREARRWKGSNGDRTLRVGRAALRSAMKRQELRRAPDVPMMREEEPEERPVPSLEQLACLCDAIEADHLRTYVVVALCTLGRPEAILDLTRDQIDFDRRILRFNAPGRRQTRKRRPEVPVCDALLPWLRRAGSGYVVSYNGRQVASLKAAFLVPTCVRASNVRAGSEPRVGNPCKLVGVA
ncbi:MAG TPA: hypothetical protein VFG47_15690 [Geminicoccaceae bacterium]|nr:hypothetical protein [Geminicoccaceae bacterium]